MTDIYARLAGVMADCDHVAKRDRNEHQRFLFRGIDAVVNAVGPVLRKHGVIVVPIVDRCDYEIVQTSTGKPATACRLLVTYTFYAPDGSFIATNVAAEAWDSGDKATPKAMSVAFRTALLQALALPTDEPDPDSQTYVRDHRPAERKAERVTSTPPDDPWLDPPPREPGDRQVSADQLKKIGAQMRELGMTDRDLALAYVKDVIGREVGSRNDLTRAEASRVIEALVKDAEQPFPEAAKP